VCNQLTNIQNKTSRFKSIRILYYEFNLIEQGLIFNQNKFHSVPVLNIFNQQNTLQFTQKNFICNVSTYFQIHTNFGRFSEGLNPFGIGKKDKNGIGPNSSSSPARTELCGPRPRLGQIHWRPKVMQLGRSRGTCAAWLGRLGCTGRRHWATRWLLGGWCSGAERKRTREGSPAGRMEVTRRLRLGSVETVAQSGTGREWRGLARRWLAASRGKR
jgi:hypothetical protein